MPAWHSRANQPGQDRPLELTAARILGLPCECRHPATITLAPATAVLDVGRRTRGRHRARLRERKTAAVSVVALQSRAPTRSRTAHPDTNGVATFATRPPTWATTRRCGAAGAIPRIQPPHLERRAHGNAGPGPVRWTGGPIPLDGTARRPQPERRASFTWTQTADGGQPGDGNNATPVTPSQAGTTRSRWV